jgi:hypothetical protein
MVSLAGVGRENGDDQSLDGELDASAVKSKGKPFGLDPDGVAVSFDRRFARKAGDSDPSIYLKTQSCRPLEGACQVGRALPEPGPVVRSDQSAEKGAWYGGLMLRRAMSCYPIAARRHKVRANVPGT